MDYFYQKSVIFCVLLLIQIHSIFNASVVTTASDGPVVTTKLGQIKGMVTTLDDEKTEVNLFQGIRYGKAPVGDLRFKKPEPEPKWDGVYEATKMRYACPQMDANNPFLKFPNDAPINEDCLFLNIWQPTQPLAEGKKRSVMFFIHGGAYFLGTAFTIAYDGRWLSSLGDVIVVTINYRLGAFGFLETGTDEAPGNTGLYDMILALQWVRDNIDAFGGDPESITIFGESAGSMAVGALVASPKTKGMFKRAIMESGSPDSFIGSDSKEANLKKFNNFAKNMKCNEMTVTDIISCLRQKTVQEILDVSFNELLTFTFFVPSYGDDLVPTRPLDAIKAGKYDTSLELLIGSNKDEGALFVASIFMDLDPHKTVAIDLSKAKQYITIIFAALNKPYMQEVVDFYTKGLDDTKQTELLRAVSDSFGDFVLTCPAMFFAEEFAKTSKTYVYRLTKQPGLSALGCTGWQGVCHADDLVSVFGFPIALRGITFSEDDFKLSKDIINVWTTFAKTGSVPAIDGVQWTEAIDKNSSSPSVRHMNLNPGHYAMVDNAFKDNCDGFWKSKLT